MTAVEHHDRDDEPRHPSQLASRGQHMTWAGEAVDRLLQLPAASTAGDGVDRADAFTTLAAAALGEAVDGCIQPGFELPAAVALVAEAVLRITDHAAAFEHLRDVYTDARAGLDRRQAHLEADHHRHRDQLRTAYQEARTKLDATAQAHQRKLDELEALTGRIGPMLEHLSTVWADVEANMAWHRRHRQPS